MEILIIISCIVALVIDYLIAKEFYLVAEAKGYADKKYLWISFLLTFIGYLLVIALPNRGIGNAENVNISITKDETTFGNKVNGFSSGAMDIPKRKRSVEEE